MNILVPIIALLISAAPAFAWDIDKMNEQIEKTNVIVSGICSGTIIDKVERLILTAHHCITDNMREVEKKEIDPETGEITIRKVMEKRPMYIEQLRRQDYKVVSSVIHTAKIKRWEEETDLAILQVLDEEWKPEMEAPIAPKDFVYKRGLPVYAVGNPGISFENSVTTGIISAPAQSLDPGGDGNEVPYFQHSASVIGGSSGGAIYDDQGRIIGTISAGLRGANIAFAVPVSQLRELLESMDIEEREEHRFVPPPAMGPR